MKNSKLLKVMCACWISFVSLYGVCYAEEPRTDVNYTPSSEQTEPTEVKVIISAKSSEFGAIYDGDTQLDIGEAIYQLKYGETKTFRIRPALGYDVFKVLYDNEDITSLLKQGRARSIQKDYYIVIAGKGHNCELDVTYKKLGSDEPILPEEPDNPDVPDNPEEPEEPENPINPDKPSVPDSNNPSTPDKPNVPSNPQQPNNPSNPNPSTTTKPKLPILTNQPVVSGSIKKPTIPDKTDTSLENQVANNNKEESEKKNPETNIEIPESTELPTTQKLGNEYIGVVIGVISGSILITIIIKKKKEITQ